MSKWYKINLLPLGPYFFGQELSAELGNKQSYFQRSAVFPQQSTLLGLLRHQILLQHGLAKPAMNLSPAVNASGLIADEGFVPGKTSSVSKYGKIEKLSPVFFQKNNQGHYFLNDREFVGDDEQKFKLIPGEEISYDSLSVKAKSTLALKCKNAATPPVVKDYSNKDLFTEELWEIGDTDHVKLDEVIQDAAQVGVYNYQKRDGEANEKDAAYFKRVYKNAGATEKLPDSKSGEEFCRKQLDSAWTFAFYVEMSDDITLTAGESRVAIMGKEQSAFLIKISDEPDNIDTSWMNTVPALGLQKLVLLSDAFVDEKVLLANSKLINGATVRFRSFSKNLSHSFLHNNLKHADKSECYHLLKRGSVIFTESAGAIAKHLEEQTNWRTIGNNYFTIKPIN